MTKLSKLFLLTIILLSCLVFAQDDTPTDAEGCKDSPLITRMQGSIIASCDNKEYEQLSVQVSADGPEKMLEGEYHAWNYHTRDGVSEIQVFRNIETALKTGGFHIVFESSPETITANKGDTWYYLGNRGVYYDQWVVTVKDMQQEVTADASSLSDAITKTGHVAVYGIHFDTGKATIQPDSESVLGEIVKLMQQTPDLKLRVEGHTDNVGSAASNQALSEKRAQAVVAWLTAHGVAANRLTAQGFGQSKPVADNSTDDGKAKNRRVELAKQ
jgi:OmpA-OmpF porin, OOP family